MKIEWNTVTWYSKLLAVIVLVGLSPVLTFYIGTQYQKTVDEFLNGSSEYNTYATTPGDEKISDAKTKHLLPSDFPQLPKNIIRELEVRGCTIPRPYWGLLKPTNVISGEFMKKGQIDWAVLCSKDKKSSILVFWNGSADSPSEIASQPDDIYVRDGQINNERGIEIEDKEGIMGYYDAFKEYGVPVPPPIDHEGIEDIFIEKASDIFYFYNGQWVELAGAD